MNDRTRAELGTFLRTRRESLLPGDAGIVDSRRRRTPGLRREEVAELAGIGVDWYLRIEQGRAVTPSRQTLHALARALRLDAAERAHLLALARPSERSAFVRETVPAPLRGFVAGLAVPAYVTGRRWDLLAWNAAAVPLLADFDGRPVDDRNVLVYMLLDPDARRLFGRRWPHEAERLIAQFRATFDLWADDPAFVALVERLRRGSERFAAWWERHDVGGAASVEKRLHHPTDGLVTYQVVSFQSNDDPALKVSIYLRKGEAPAPALRQPDVVAAWEPARVSSRAASPKSRS